jgi:hypothetical protein
MKIHAVDGDVSVMELLQGTDRVIKTLAAIAEQRDQDIEGLSSVDVACFLAVTAPGLLVTLELLRLHSKRLMEVEDMELSAAVEKMLQGVP